MGEYGKIQPRYLWERQAVDTNESWPYFKAYRDLKGSRRLDRVRLAADEMGRRNPHAPTLQQLRDWCEQHQWRERVKGYDQHMDKILAEEKETALRESARDQAAAHLELIQDAHELAENELKKLLQASRESSAHGLLKPSDLFKLFEAAIKLGRLVKGESTEIAEERVDLSKLSMEELKELRKLQAKVEGDK